MSHRWFSSEHFDEGLACLEPLQEFWQQRRELGSQFRFLEIADSEPEHRRCRLRPPDLHVKWSGGERNEKETGT